MEADIRARIWSVMHNASLSREQKHCLAQAIYCERMQEEPAQVKNDGRNERTFWRPGEYGCAHYKRNCRIKAECCDTFYTCRICHNESCRHNIDRFATKTMVCMFCLTVQDVAAECANKACGKRMAKYFCAKCRLFVDEYEGEIFHCDDCGLCRKAENGKDDYFHCKECNTCMSASAADHKCLSHIMDSNCPVCNEYLFDSMKRIIFPDCRHPMHLECMKAYAKVSYTCPVCMRSLFNCDEYNQQVEEHVSAHQMPPEYANHVAEILCNDCLIKSEVKFHFLYHKCFQCGGFNTRVLRSGPAPLPPENPNPPPSQLSSTSLQAMDTSDNRSSSLSSSASSSTTSSPSYQSLQPADSLSPGPHVVSALVPHIHAHEPHANSSSSAAPYDSSSSTSSSPHLAAAAAHLNPFVVSPTRTLSSMQQSGETIMPQAPPPHHPIDIQDSSPGDINAPVS